MANNYTVFSTSLVIGRYRLDEKKAWFIRQLWEVLVYPKLDDDGEIVEGETVMFEDGEVPQRYEKEFDCEELYRGPRFLYDYEDRQDDEPSVGFHMDNLREPAPEDGEPYYVFYCEESGDPNTLAWLVQKYFKEFDPTGIWAFEFCHYCDKPRIDEFGGGAVVVTAEQQYWFDTFCAIDDKVRELKPWTEDVKMREVEYWRCWAGNDGDSGFWDTDFIEIPFCTPENQYDAMVREAVRRIKDSQWRDEERPMFVGFYAEDDYKEEDDEADEG